MVESDYKGQVGLVRREENSVTGGRNDGFRAARGEFMLSLDNDIQLPDKAVIRKGVEIFERYPEAGVLAFRIGDPDDPDRHLPEHWWHPIPLEEGVDRFFRTTYFTESAILMRAEAYQATGGYDEKFFMQAEYADLGLKLMGAGFEILYCPNLGCIEVEVRGQLAPKKSRAHYLNLRNKLWTAWKHYPLGRGLAYGSARIAAAAYRSVRYGWVGYFLAGTRDGVFAPKAIREQRRPLPPDVWKEIDRIAAGWLIDDVDTESR